MSPVLATTSSTPGGALIVSHDPALVEQLRGALDADLGARVQMAATFHDAEDLLEGWRPAAVLIDFRRTGAGEDPTPLLDRLGRQGGPSPAVIAISEAGYTCDWAALADLIVSGHVQLPLDRRQLAHLVGRQLASGDAPRAELTLTPRMVQARSFSYKTYTPEMFGLLDDLTTVAGHDVTVLLTGETGTGKTTLARILHELSDRHPQRLVTVACGALPPDLIESELFGHVKGAFTSAEQTRQGKFDAARGGTLLLDEIDVLGPGQQAKLLRVIENGEYEPVGSNDTRTSQARLIVASNVDLKSLLDRNAFRADLYYRLSMLELHVPPLRQRPRDIVPMTLDFIDEFCTAHGIRIRRVHPEFLAYLKAYHWPGNVRELKNHVRRAVLFCKSGTLVPTDLASQFHRARQATTPSESPSASGGGTLDQRVAQTERGMLEQALRAHRFNRTATALALGLSRVGLYKKLKRLGLSDCRE